MGSSNQELTGPDLKAGIDTKSLAPGQRILGEADGEQILLINDGGMFHAVAASCTHYGGPLNDGIVVDGTIRCPWHHACFRLESGEAARPPALNPISVWRTEVRDGTVFVREKRDPAAPNPRGLSRQRIVIVGSGAAGHAAAEMLRRRGYDGALTMVSEDGSLPYDRPNLSKDFLAGNAPEEWIPLRDADFYKSAAIEVRLATKVAALDPAKKTVTLASGDVLPFDKCLLATGGRPVLPPIAGKDQPHVRTLRSLADCRALIAALGTAKSVAIVGAGFIGLEAAAALRTRGLAVTMIAPEDVPLAKVVGPEVGAFLKSVHEGNGVRLRLGQTVKQIEQNQVVLSDGSREPGDIVLIATGIRPDITLAQAAGLQCGNGIVVDQYLQTSAAGVYAAGDVALWPDPRSGEHIRIEHWAVAQRQGQVAALNMLGEETAYTDVPFFWTHQADVTLNYVGHASTTDKTTIDGPLEARDCAVSYYEGERLAALLTIGRDRQSLETEHTLEQTTK
jgi:NADPH-dependent 2,4-dienoyl-CoA reductase/sulfur reductase-like enzyme/nitrite reductase/ring-hydroxylating ferredoxin subunit